VAALEDTFSAKKPEDQLKFRISGDRLEVLLRPDTVESIHKKIRPEPFLSDLIAYFSSVHHPNMDDVLRIFRKYSNDLIIEEVPEENLIFFTIDGIEYSAKEGMIWSRWTGSKYNTKDFSVVEDTVRTGNSYYHSYVTHNAVRVTPTDLIIDGGEYGIEEWSSGGSND
jgi:hypothetical protein